MPCKCPQCYSFSEWALENLGQDYGLPKAPGHALKVVPKEPSMTEVTPDELRALIARKKRKRKAFFWEEDAA